MTTKYLAIPLLVYVPEGHAFSTLRGEEYTESSLLDHLQLIGLEPLIAEDFQSTTIETDHTTTEHAARISVVCPAIHQEPRTNPGLDATRSFDSPSQAVDYCLSFPQPYSALAEIIAFNIIMDEFGFASEVIAAFPNGPLPEIQTP